MYRVLMSKFSTAGTYVPVLNLVCILVLNLVLGWQLELTCDAMHDAACHVACMLSALPDSTMNAVGMHDGCWTVAVLLLEIVVYLIYIYMSSVGRPIPVGGAHDGATLCATGVMVLIRAQYSP
jgi:hypothetical protein